MKSVKIQSNSEELSANVYESEDAKALLIIASATGVKQSYYRKFAAYAAGKQVTVITFDYGGIGQSLNKPIWQLTNNAIDWGRDLQQVIIYALQTYPDLKTCILGHSMGGQLVGLCHSALEVDKIILVAAQSGYWKLWKGTGKVMMWLNWHLLFPTLINLFGYFPGKKLSGMENLPKNVASQWSGWGRRKEYLLNEVSMDESNYDQLTTSITAISIDDDSYAPKSAVDWMSSKYSKADLKSIHLIPGDYNTNKIGHFGIFREKFKDNLWPLMLGEIPRS